jgi:hypothetical protein
VNTSIVCVVRTHASDFCIRPFSPADLDIIAAATSNVRLFWLSTPLHVMVLMDRFISSLYPAIN